MVELEIRKTFQFLHKKFSLECKVNANPVDKLYWYKNGVIYDTQSNENDNNRHQERSVGLENEQNNLHVDKYDISQISDYFKTLLTLTVLVNLFSRDLKIKKDKIL